MKKVTDKTRISESKRTFPGVLFSVLVGGAALVTSKPLNALGLKNSRNDFYVSCSRCNYCVQNCPVEAFEYDQNRFPHIVKEKCMAWDSEKKILDWDLCGICLRGCPTRTLEHLNAKQYEPDRKDDNIKTTIKMLE